MSRTQKKTLIGIALVFIALVLLAISRYEWNVSALLHVSHDFGETYDVPSGIVLYEKGYDGMLYYQIARDVPEIIFGTGQSETYDNVYRAQRILLPLFGFLLSFGKDFLLPYAFLFINIASILGALP